MKKITSILLILFSFQITLTTAQNSKESVLDRITHIEDSIHYSVPELPKLCDSIKFESKMLDIGNCRLFVEIEGEGPAIVLVNGGPGGTHHYFHPWFSALKNNHKIIYYDQRGTGQSDFEPGEGYSFLQAVNDLEALRKQLEIEKWVVLGYSYGGAVAQVYSILFPEKVSGMVLLNTLPLLKNHEFDSDQKKYFSEEEKQKQEEIINLARSGEMNISTLIYNMQLNGDWKRQSFYKPTKNEMIRTAHYEWVNDKKFNSIVSGSSDIYNLEGCFSEFPIPTLIFEGEHDLTWGHKKAEVIRENHPKARFVLVEDVAHPIFSENPNLFFAELNSFTQNLKVVSADEIQKWRQSVDGKLEQF